MVSRFEQELSGGHPNSLGNTVKVVNIVLKDKEKINDLFLCYSSEDEVVRLRTSNAFKRIFRKNPDWFKPLISKFFKKVPQLNQASAMWTLSQICLECEEQLSMLQKKKAKEIIKNFMKSSEDWIVLNASIQTLGEWSAEDAELRKWLVPKIEKFSKDKRKSVAKRAQKFVDKLCK